MQIRYTPAVRAEARAAGIELPEFEEVEVLPAVVDVGSDFGADFGFLNLKAAVKKAVGTVKTNVTATAGGNAPGIINGQAVAFAVSPIMSVKTAMAAADRLLGDPKIANAANIVKNTKALAALGDPAAKRGLVALQAVGNIRAQTGAPAGKKVIQAKAPSARSVTIKRTPAQVRRMATKTAAKVNPKRPNLFKRILISIGFIKR